ncbi:MAG: prefoldin subunit beta [Candidatus Aenigmatarchaeota archaeon]
MKLSPQAQQILIQMQTFQQQLQSVLIQKESLNLQNIEIAKALEELEKSDKEEVYKAVGPILIKSDKKELEKDLKEKEETTNLRLKSLSKQEEKLKEKLDENQKKLEEILKTQQKSEGS